MARKSYHLFCKRFSVRFPRVPRVRLAQKSGIGWIFVAHATFWLNTS